MNFGIPMGEMRQRHTIFINWVYLEKNVIKSAQFGQNWVLVQGNGHIYDWKWRQKIGIIESQNCNS